jgi:hypothetical protein
MHNQPTETEEPRMTATTFTITHEDDTTSTRTSKTKTYTHAVAVYSVSHGDTEPTWGALSWHTSKALAEKARSAAAKTFPVLAVVPTTTTTTTTKKENDMTENTTAKPAEKKAAAKKAAAPAKVRAYKVPKGYEVKWQHGGHDLLKKADAATKGPAWFTACNAHGDLHEAANAKEAEGFGVLKVRATWCKGDHKPAAKKAPAKKAPAKKAATKAPAKAAASK